LYIITNYAWTIVIILITLSEMYIAIVDIQQKVGKYLTGRHFCMANYLTKITRWLYIINIEQLSAVIFLDRFHLSFLFSSYFFVTLYSIWVASLLLLELLVNISGCHYWSSWTLVSIKITMYFLYIENRFLWVMKLVSEFWFGGALHTWKDLCLLDILNVSAICLKDKG
jgi:hypothetical protein